MPENTGDVTELLHRWREGDSAAEKELFTMVLPNLRRLAHYFMKGERPGHLLQPTALVNTIYIRLVAAKDRDWRNRRDFYAIAARAMRRHLIDIARKDRRAEFVPLEDMKVELHADSPKLDLAITIDRLLDQLAGTKPDWCMVVEVKYFLGLTDEEAADLLGMKVRSMQRIWHQARRWLYERTEGNATTGHSAG
jgi:RNA polymerase sigma factor (TIGR02999 family)